MPIKKNSRKLPENIRPRPPFSSHGKKNCRNFFLRFFICNLKNQILFPSEPSLIITFMAFEDNKTRSAAAFNCLPPDRRRRPGNQN
jgi:hypothetical protein